MLRLLDRVIQREGCASPANKTTQRRTEHLRLTKGRVEDWWLSVLAAKSTVAQAQASQEVNEATRQSAEAATGEAAACSHRLSLRDCFRLWRPALELVSDQTCS